jgi:SNF2 family DNA or RNA helicase
MIPILNCLIYRYLAESFIFRLNLACASQIHILEPQWNPMVEEQAIGRALRLDQKREVTVIRYVMEGTIEKVGFHSIT